MVPAPLRLSQLPLPFFPALGLPAPPRGHSSWAVPGECSGMQRRDSPGREKEGGALGLEGRTERASLLTEPDRAGEEGAREKVWV